MCFSCSKHEITIDALSFEKDEIFLDENRVELQLVNHSNQIFSLVSNNLDTINISEKHSFYYKLYNNSFEEIDKDEITISIGIDVEVAEKHDTNDAEYTILDEIDIWRGKKTDSLHRYKEHIIPVNDTLILPFFVKKIYYEDPLFYQEYDLEPGKEYYIRFFYRNTTIKEAPTVGKLFIGEIKSPYYKLRL